MTSALVPDDHDARVDLALSLYLRGLSSRKIAAELGVAPATAWRWVDAGLKREPDANLAVQRKVANERSRELWLVATEAVESARTFRERQDAIRTAALVLKEWRKLQGVDAAERVRFEHDDNGLSAPEAQIAEWIKAARVRDADPEWERS